MKKDWRQTTWKDFSFRQKWLFILLLIEFSLFMFAALFFPYWGIEIPNWLGILIVVALIVPLNKFLDVTPWAAPGYEDDEDDDDDDDETDTDDDY